MDGEHPDSVRSAIEGECHHVPAVSFERVLKHVKARYLTGLTATPRVPVLERMFERRIKG